MLIIGDLIRSLETIVVPDELDRVKAELNRSADKLDSGEFQNLRVAESTFGASPRGLELGSHHVRAHTVIAETLEGVIADLRDFRDGVERAEQMLTAADEGAAADLRSRQEAVAVAALVDANRSFASDQRYEAARNRGGAEG